MQILFITSKNTFFLDCYETKFLMKFELLILGDLFDCRYILLLQFYVSLISYWPRKILEICSQLNHR